MIKYSSVKWFKKLLLMAVLSVIAGVLFVLVSSFISSKDSASSPLPTSLTLFKNQQVSTLDIWQPLIEALFPDSNKIPQISAESALVYDLTTEKVLYSKNPKEKLPMASITKIMTAIIALENKKSDDKYFVTDDALVGENSMGLSSGETLSLNELLYGMLLHSGNDAAETIATNYPQGRAAFISAMNKKAKALGLNDTNFTNPSGLEGDGNQHTTTYDLLVITRFALNFEQFANTVSTFRYHIFPTSTHKEFYLENETNLISSYPGVKGVKDGYTPEAGLCLVTYLEHDGHKIIGIILGSDNRRQEMKDLLDYSLKSEGLTPPQHQ